MKLSEAVILAGGLGTRLRSVVNDLPKVMAPVNGKPFLHYILQKLEHQGIRNIILSVGYLRESIMDWCADRYPSLNIRFAIEETPLGTGGGIANALRHCTTTNVLLLNGDTFLEADYDRLSEELESTNCSCVVALKEMRDFDRYGTVELNDRSGIISFNEKSYREKGLINAGVYVIDRLKFLAADWPEKFSFEKDFLEKSVDGKSLKGTVIHGYFIDIGIPSDYEKAQTDFQQLFPS